MKELELLDAPAPHRPYQRLPLPPAGLTLGGPRSDVVVHAGLSACRIEVVGGRVAPRLSGDGTADVFPGGLVALELGGASVWLRVVDAGAPALAWPELPACLGAEAAPPGAGAAQVLTDALLEVAHPLGAQLRGDAAPGDGWLAHFGQLGRFGEVELQWSHGLVDHALIRGGARGLRSFAGHALLHLVRSLDLVAYDPADALDALAVGTLPWLEELRVHHVGRKQQRALEKKVKALAHAFPRARPVWLPRLNLGVETRGQVEVLPPDRAIVLDGRGAADGGIRVIERYVRWANHVPLLGLANGELVLNGKPLVRPPRIPSWGVPLALGDVFTIDGLERKVVALQ